MDKIELSEDYGLIIPRSLWPAFGPFGDDKIRYMSEAALALLLTEEETIFVTGGKSHFITSKEERKGRSQQG